MRCSVFVGISVDGFLARPDHTFDFLPEDAEPHGFEEFFASVDTIVIGRNTYDVVAKFPDWPYGKTRVVVLSSRRLEDARVEWMSGAPEQIVNKLTAAGVQHAYVDGGVTIQRFLAAGLIDRMVITRVPVLIGRGIPLFGELPADVRLKHLATRTYPSGLVQSEYERA